MVDEDYVWVNITEAFVVLVIDVVLDDCDFVHVNVEY